MDFFIKNFGERPSDNTDTEAQAKEGENQDGVPAEGEEVEGEGEEPPVNSSNVEDDGGYLANAQANKGSTMNPGMKKDRENFKKKLGTLIRKLKDEELQN